jgi:hypothetical protein
MKGDAGIAIALVMIIVVAVAILFLFPNILGGLFSGGTSAPIGVGPGTAGVVITSFVATPAITEAGEEVTFTLTVQNKGGIDADNIDYTIFGLTDWDSVNSDEDGSNTLTREDPTRQIVGETSVQEWSATSNEKNTDITYPVTARVDYSYETESDVVLTLYGRDNPNVKGRGVTQSSIGQIAVTGGPLSVVPKGTIPLIGSKQEFTMSFDITNIGGGRTYTDDRGSDLDKIKISSPDCEDMSNKEVRLINNVRSVSCRLQADIDNEGQQTMTVHLDIEYNYIVESTTNVRVLKVSQ